MPCCGDRLARSCRSCAAATLRNSSQPGEAEDRRGQASSKLGTLLVWVGLADRAWLREEAPETDCVRDAYAPYPVVLVRVATRSKRTAGLVIGIMAPDTSTCPGVRRDVNALIRQ